MRAVATLSRGRGPTPARFLTAIVDEAHPAEVTLEGDAAGELTVFVRGEGGERRVVLK